MSDGAHEAVRNLLEVRKQLKERVARIEESLRALGWVDKKENICGGDIKMRVCRQDWPKPDEKEGLACGSAEPS